MLDRFARVAEAESDRVPVRRPQPKGPTQLPAASSSSSLLDGLLPVEPANAAMQQRQHEQEDRCQAYLLKHQPVGAADDCAAGA